MDRRLDRRKARRWPWIAVVGLLFIVAIVTAAVWLVPASGTLSVERASLRVAAVTAAPFEDYVPIRAEVAPLETAVLTVLAGGQVREVVARDGQHLEVGDPIAFLSNAQLQLDVSSREAEIVSRLGDVSSQQLAQQRALSDRAQQVAQANYALLVSQRELEKRQRLQAAGLITDVGIRSFTDEVAYNRSQLAMLTRQQAQELAAAARQNGELRDLAVQLRKNLTLVHASLEALTLRASTAGRLTNFDLQPGQSLTAGQSVGQVDSENAYKLQADIDEFYLSRVAVGQSATADLAGKKVPLQVARSFAQVTNGRFRAEFTFQAGAPQGLKRGQSLDVRLRLGDTRKALVLPNEAWMEDSGGSFAFVLTPSGKRADRRSIVTGRRNPEQVEVLSGLQPGERVIVSSYGRLETYKHLVLR